MLLLNLLSYVTAIVAFLFVTLSLGTPPTQNSHSTQPSVSASGLLWLAEIIEENSRFAKVIGVRAVYVRTQSLGLRIIHSFDTGDHTSSRRSLGI